MINLIGNNLKAPTPISFLILTIRINRAALPDFTLIRRVSNNISL